MKKLNLLFIVPLLSINVVLADNIDTNPTVAPLVSIIAANPDHRRISSSALILKSDGQIFENTIPSNAISKPESIAPKNKVVDGKISITK